MFRKKLVLEGSNVKIYFPFFEKDIDEAIRKIPTNVLIAKERCFQVTIVKKSALPFVDFCNRFDFDVPEGVAAKVLPLAEKAVREEEQRLKEMEENKHLSSVMHSDFDTGVFAGGKKLRTYQNAGVEYALKNKNRIILGDDMGLGKTAMSIIAVNQASHYPVFIACPNSVKYNWKREYNGWLPDKTVSVLDTTKKNFSLDADVVIGNYNMMDKLLSDLKAKGFQAVIYDESQYLKNKTAKRTKNAKDIASKAKTRLLLTGTAIVNRPSELIAQLDIIGRLNDFGGYWSFANRYCDPQNTKFGKQLKGATNLEELHEKLRSICYIRREKKDVLKELPDKSRITLEVDLDNRSTYVRAEADVIEFLRNKAIAQDDFLASLHGLSAEEVAEEKKNRASEAGLRAARAEQLVRINTLKTLAAKGKLKSIFEWTDDFLESGEKLVIFATHTEMIEAIAERYACPYITGAVKPEERQHIVNRFQEEPSIKVLVVNLAAGAVGIDGLQHACSSVLFVEQGWTPAEHDQAEARLDRMGQKNAVNCYYMLANDTIDLDIYNLIEEKRKVTDAVNKGTVVEEGKDVLKEIVNILIKK